MAIKKIRLTESQLTSLIKRIVEDTENDMGMEMGMNFNDEDDSDMTKQDAIRKISEFLKDEVLSDLSSREINTLERKVEKSENNVSENIYEDDEDLSSRRASRREKMMMRGGLGMSATGAVLSLGEFMGYSESQITSMLHDLNHMAGLERYTGPVTVAMVFAGLALALKGLDSRYRRTGN
jgi:DNA-binding MarR family transcriptional regulator